MALQRVRHWQAGDVLTANDLENEFNNVTTNGLSEPFTATQQVDLNGQLLILDANGDTLLDGSVDNTVDVTIGGADDFRFTANTFTALAGSSIVVASGGLTVTAGTLSVMDGATTLADPDSRTTTVATPLTVAAETSGTPAAGIGTGILFTAESQDEAPSNVGQAQFAFSDVTTASEDSYFQVMLRVAGAALSAAYKWMATTAFQAIFTHANSADRTYTLPNFDGTLATLAGTETFTNKTLTAPTITAPVVSGYAAAPATPTAGVTYNESFVRGYAIFDVSGNLDTDLNVASVTDNGPGDWTVNWATAFATANYCVQVTIQGEPRNGGSAEAQVFSKTTTACRVTYGTQTGAVITYTDPTSSGTVRIHVVAFGVQ